MPSTWHMWTKWCWNKERQRANVMNKYKNKLHICERKSCWMMAKNKNTREWVSSREWNDILSLFALLSENKNFKILSGKLRPARVQAEEHLLSYWHISHSLRVSTSSHSVCISSSLSFWLNFSYSHFHLSRRCFYYEIFPLPPASTPSINSHLFQCCFSFDLI